MDITGHATLAQFSLFPQQASTVAGDVDGLFYFLLAVSGSVGLLVAVLILYLAIKYRRRSPQDHVPRILGSLRLELFWTLTPLLVFLAMFLWGAQVFFTMARPPQDAMDVFVVGKQWMWKAQHPRGQREINTLHVPLGRPVRLTLTSEDVIHSFFVPAFRIKQDVLPGRYVQTWFQPTRTGEFHLFCAEYCGTHHSGMVGTVVVMEQQAFQDWLDFQAEGAPALEGRKLFKRFQCAACHTGDAKARGPNLAGVYGRTVLLRDGQRVAADAAYLRESILRPKAKVVAGWEPIMPSYAEQLADSAAGVGEEEAIVQLIAYLQSLTDADDMQIDRVEDFPPPPPPPPLGKDAQQP
jgi:cytochrome c oxidase subunit 2